MTGADPTERDDLDDDDDAEDDDDFEDDDLDDDDEDDDDDDDDDDEDDEDDEDEDDEDDEDDGGPDPNVIPGALSRRVLDYVARSIVDDPESIVIEGSQRGSRVTLRLHVAPADMGRIIGRRGRVAQAIRTVVRAAGAREGIETEVDIVD